MQWLVILKKSSLEFSTLICRDVLKMQNLKSKGRVSETVMSGWLGRRPLCFHLLPS